MPAGIAITNTDHPSPCQLRLMARKCKDANHSRRLLAIAGALTGDLGRTAIAEHAGVGLQTLRDWILRDNKEGPLGLQTRQGQGRPSILDLDRPLFLRDCLETGPPPGLSAWTLSWLRDIIDEVFKVTLSLETIRRVIRRLMFDFRRGFAGISTGLQGITFPRAWTRTGLMSGSRMRHASARRACSAGFGLSRVHAPGFPVIAVMDIVTCSVPCVRQPERPSGMSVTGPIPVG